ncbi:resolvase [Anaerotruncus sp. 1XD42-93]|nr:resolvase [Anaerotruncus sp. 1XD42-93]
MEVDIVKKITAIYVRRSVSDRDKDNNSLSIDSQKADCIKSLGEGEEYHIYCDDGKSGKDIEHRPAFQQMMADAKEGLIERIIVKKYDRFSRNMREYLNVTDLLDSYGVSVVSLTEPFNTATKEGRMMRNTLLNFAEFERETIAGRVADAYSTRSLETGFYQGGKFYYGYMPERRTVNGKNGSVLVPSDKADVVRMAYQLYKAPEISLADVLNYFRSNGIDVNRTAKSNMDRSHFSRILESPLYVRADKDVYQYLVSKGYEVVDDVEAFDGVHGCFRHKRPDGSEYIKVGYHEGLVDAETWLTVQDKKSRNKRIPNSSGAKNSWLVGLVKCGHCHYALSLMYSWNVTKTKQWRYFGDHGAYRAKGCIKKRLKTRPDEVEQIVFQAMKERLESLVIAKAEQQKPDSEAESIKVEIIRLDDEIHKLMDKLADADNVLFGYIQDRVNVLHSKKSELEEKLRAKVRKHKEIDTAPLADPMSRWDTLTVDEKHALAITMIDIVYVSDEYGVEIQFSI